MARLPFTGNDRLECKAGHFLETALDGLRAMGVRPDRITWES